MPVPYCFNCVACVVTNRDCWPVSSTCRRRVSEIRFDVVDSTVARSSYCAPCANGFLVPADRFVLFPSPRTHSLVHSHPPCLYCFFRPTSPKGTMSDCDDLSDCSNSSDSSYSKVDFYEGGCAISCIDEHTALLRFFLLTKQILIYALPLENNPVQSQWTDYIWIIEQRFIRFITLAVYFTIN